MIDHAFLNYQSKLYSIKKSYSYHDFLIIDSVKNFN